jgi:hypothetical protein
MLRGRPILRQRSTLKCALQGANRHSQVQPRGGPDHLTVFRKSQEFRGYVNVEPVG